MKKKENTKKLMLEMMIKIDPTYKKKRLNEEHEIYSEPDDISYAKSLGDKNDYEATDFDTGYEEDSKYDGYVSGIGMNPDMSENNVQTEPRPLSQIAREIARDWGQKVNYAAKPYLQAMATLNNVNDRYGMDSAKSIVLYFLSNASSWRGENAKRIKTELKNMVGLKESLGEEEIPSEEPMGMGGTEPTKYRADVAGIKEMRWSSNGKEYNTEEEAKKWLDDLSSRWFGYDLSRVVPVSTPKGETIDFKNNVFYQKYRSGVNETEGIVQEEFQPDYSNGEYFEDKLEEIIQQMIQSDYDYDSIKEIIEKILQRQP